MSGSRSDEQQDTVMVLPPIPLHLLEDILSRLPVKSLIRFESVSKQWRSLIRSQSFIDLHWRFRRRSQILASYDRRSSHFSIGPQAMFIGSSRSVGDEEEICYMHYNASEALFCCDGLVCCIDVNSESIDVFNPSTRQFRRFPPGKKFRSPNFRSGNELPGLEFLPANVLSRHSDSWVLQRTRLPRGYLIGFGRDNATGTYKVVRLYSSRLICTECAVLPLDETRKWRYVSPIPYPIFLGQNSVHLNGSVYWFTVHLWNRDGDAKILAFDLHTERFRIVPHPLPCSEPSHLVEMVNLRDRLCISDVTESNSRLEIWSMRPEDERWERMCSISLFEVHRSPKIRLFTPLTVCEKGRVVFWDHNGRLFKYYPETEKVLRICHEETWVIASYMESLVRIP